jgi:hypothetical protein
MHQLASQSKRCTQKHWRILIIALAVCSLTVNVATRYSSCDLASVSIAKVLHKHSSPEKSRQRLTKVASSWLRPVTSSTPLQAPASYPRIAPAGPPIPGTFFEASLYDRPPPASFLA